jgi:hypothetical protein
MKQVRPVSNPIPATLEIWDLTAGQIIREHNVNNVKSSREFIQNTMVWALSNGHGVQLSPPRAIPPSPEEK